MQKVSRSPAIGMTLSQRIRRTLAHWLDPQVEREKLRAETARVLWAVRDIFDHLPAYVTIDPGYAEMARSLSQALAKDAVEVAMYAESSLHAQQLWGLASAHEITRQLADLNDPVLNRLWQAATPSAIAQMLRHALFAGMGYPYAVAWEEGLFDPEKVKGPGYTNWGAASLANVEANVLSLFSCTRR